MTLENDYRRLIDTLTGEMEQEVLEDSGLMQSLWLSNPKSLAAGLALLYIVAGSIYIIVSGLFAARLAVNVEHLWLVETLKGVGFILFSGAIVFFALYYTLYRAFSFDILLYRLRERLRESAGLIDVASELLPEPVVVVDREGLAVLCVNRAFYEATGFVEEDVLGKNIFDLYAWFSSTADEREVFEAIRKGQIIQNREYTMEAPRGEFHLLLNGRPSEIRGKSAYLIVSSDLTEIKRAQQNRLVLERQLSDAHRMEAIGTLAAGVAHDFHNVLTAVRGYTDQLRSDDITAEEQREVIAGIEEASHTAQDMVRSLLTFSKGGERNLEPINIVGLLRGTEGMLRHVLPARVELEISIPDDDLWITGDRAELQQVMLNLVVNARDAIEEHGKISISIAESSEGQKDSEPGMQSVVLIVADDGSGIDDQVLDRIFEPFFSTRRRTQGTGLGLAIVHGIVERLGGAVQVFSTPGVGTRFKVRLPLCEQLSDSTRENGKMLTEFHGRVLVADDDPQVSSVLKSMLSEAGFEVCPVTSREEANRLAASSEEDFSLVVVDVGLLGADPPGGISTLRKVNSALPILLISGSPESEVFSESLESVKFLAKPFGLRQLGSAIHDLIGEEGS